MTKKTHNYFCQHYLCQQIFERKKFLTPLLRDLDCGMDVYNLDSCFKISFWVPTGFIFLGRFSHWLIS